MVNVSLRDVQDASLLRVPTALTILPLQVRQLEAAGRQAMRESPEFQRLRLSLRGAESLAATLDVAPSP